VGKPESAVVAFSEHENLDIVFGTSNTTRKYKNLQRNLNVSLVVGWDSKVGTFQCDGIARELSKEEAVKYSALMVKKNPHSAKFVDREDQRYFIVKPVWVRLLDMSVVPDTTFETFL
jgi:pyridoxine/pyridoxamine 5'-phosphate oxidase